MRDELEAARRVAKRQAAPFSKGAPKATPRRSGRKAGRHYGPRRWRPRPAHVDTVVEVFPPAACPHGGDAVVGTGDVRLQYQAITRTGAKDPWGREAVGLPDSGSRKHGRVRTPSRISVSSWKRAKGRCKPDAETGMPGAGLTAEAFGQARPDRLAL